MTEQPYNTVALFGATGQIGRAFLDALLHPSTPGYAPHVKVFLRNEQWDAKASTIPDDARVEKVRADFGDVGQLARQLEGVDALVSALNGPGIDAQYAILDAAAEAGACSLERATAARQRGALGTDGSPRPFSQASSASSRPSTVPSTPGASPETTGRTFTPCVDPSSRSAVSGDVLTGLA